MTDENTLLGQPTQPGNDTKRISFWRSVALGLVREVPASSDVWYARIIPSPHNSKALTLEIQSEPFEDEVAPVAVAVPPIAPVAKSARPLEVCARLSRALQVLMNGA